MVPMVRFLSRLACIAAVSAFLWACDKSPGGPDVEAIDAADEPIRDFLRTAAATSQNSSNYAAAANYYRSLHVRDSNDIEAILGLARNLRYIGAADEATKLLKEALDQYPDRIDLRAELGKAQIAMGEASNAVETLAGVTEASPSDWRSLSALGIAYDLLENYSQAQASYWAALEVSPKNIAVLNNLALSKALAGELAEGISILEQASALPRPGNQVRQNLALLYAMKGDIETAEGLLKQGLSEEIAQHNLTFYRQLHSRLARRVGRRTRKIPAPTVQEEALKDEDIVVVEAEPDEPTEAAEPAEQGGIEQGVLEEGGIKLGGIGVGGARVQLGVFSTRERASAWLLALRDVHPDLLSDLRFEIDKVGVGAAAAGYRLVAGPLASEAVAADLCTKLHSRKETCTIIVVP